MKKIIICLLLISAIALCTGCVGGGDSTEKGGNEYMGFPLKGERKRNGQLYTEGQMQFPAYLWETPASERYSKLDNGSAKGYFIKSYNDNDVFCFVGIPQGASKENKVPGIALVHGGGGTAYFEWVNYWVRHGYAAIAMDTEGNMPLPNSFMNNSERTASIKQKRGPLNPGSFSDINKPIVEQWGYNALAAIISSISFLSSFEEVDADRIGLTGISYGGFLAWQIAAYDDRLIFSVPVYGSPEQLQGDTAWKDWFADERYGAKKAELYDNIAILEGCTTPIFFVNSNIDEFFSPLSASISAQSVINGALLLKHNYPHGHDVGGLMIDEIPVFADSIAKGGAGLAMITVQPSKENPVLEFSVPEGVTVTEATVYCASDSVLNSKTFWTPLDVLPENNAVEISYPGNTEYYFVNLKDSRGLEITSRLVKVN